MITGITKDKHWILDYTYVPFVLAAPELVGFKKSNSATNACRAFSSIALVYSLMTDSSSGVVKLIPYRTHAALDWSQHGSSSYAL